MLRFLLPLFSLALTAHAMALPSAISSPQAVGSASFSLLGVSLYDATLYTENGSGYSANAPFILELAYKRNVSRDRLVSATISEMERQQGSVADRENIQAQLNQCFRDVGAGDRFAAVNRGANQVDFYLNDQKTCTLSAGGISQRFFGIWLGGNTRAPALSQQLRGQ